MNIRSTLRRPERTLSRVRLLISLIAAVLAVGVFATANAGAATAADPGFKFDKGHWVGSHWVGTIKTGSIIAVCLQPGKPLTRAQTYTEIQKIANVSPEVSAEIAEALASHTGGVLSDTQGSAVAIATNELAGNAKDVQQWKKALGATVTALAESYVTEAKKLHGPFTIMMTIQTPAQVGSPGRLRVKVISAAHYGVPNKVVGLTATGATLPSAVRTNSSGLAVPTYVRTGNALPVINASTTLASTAVLSGHAVRNEQELKAAAKQKVYKARATYKLPFIVPTLTYQCTNCLGNPPVTSAAPNPAAVPARYIRTVDNVVNATLMLNPGQTSNITANIHDGAHVVTQLQYLVNGAWTDLVTVDDQVIDCPVVPDVHEELVCPCGDTAAHVHIFLSPVAGNQPVAIFVDGKQVATAPSSSGLEYRFDIAVGHDSLVKYRAGALRRNGEWVYGPVLGVFVG